MHPIKGPDAWLLLFIWIFVQAALLYTNGIVTNGEAEQYIYQAQYLIDHGRVSTGHYWLYFTEIILIATSLKLKTGFVLVVVVQLLLNLTATIKLFSLSKSIFKNNIPRYLLIIFFLVNVPYQEYNSFLYTESCFYSLVIIYTCLLLELKNLQVNKIFILFLFLIVLCITRPTGLLFLPATIFYLTINFYREFKRGGISLAVVSTIIIFIFVLNIYLKTGGSLQIMIPFQQQMVICGVPTISEPPLAPADNSMMRLWNFILTDTTVFFKLTKLKTTSFFGFTRDFYSPRHNIFLVSFYYPWYLLSAIGVAKHLQTRFSTLACILSLIFLFWLTTIFSCDDWHNRFAITITPFLFLLGLLAFEKKSTSHS